MLRFVLLLSILILGCSGKEKNTAPVQGTIKVDGQPLTAGTVTFFPKTGRSARGAIQSDGSYVLSTYSDDDGAQPGLHKVTITAAAKGGSAEPNFDKDNVRPSIRELPFPPRYSNPSASGLTFEVKAGEDNQADFNLEK